MEPLQNKNAETVGRATKRAARDLTGDDGNFVVTTDLGNEFATLDRELPEAVRRTKHPFLAPKKTLITLKLRRLGGNSRTLLKPFCWVWGARETNGLGEPIK